jgi:hypothetical protein
LYSQDASNKPTKKISYTYGFGNYSPKVSIEDKDANYRESIIQFIYTGQQNNGFKITFGGLSVSENYFGYCEGDILENHKNTYSNSFILPALFFNWKYFGFDAGLYYELKNYNSCSDDFIDDESHIALTFRSGLIDKIFLSFSLYDDLLIYSKMIGVTAKDILNFSYIFFGGFWDKNFGLTFKTEYIFFQRVGINLQLQKQTNANNYGFRLGAGYYW